MKTLKKYQLNRIVILGTGQLAITTAQFAISHGLDVQVFLGPRQADHLLSDGTPARVALEALGVIACICPDIRQKPEGPYSLYRDGAIVFSFGSPYIIRQDLIDLYRGLIFNSHGAPLPEWRGGGGYSWRILAGDRRGRTCFHLVTSTVDTGDIVYRADYEFPDDLRYPRDYASYANERATEGLNQFLRQLYDGEPLAAEAQDETRSSYFPRLNTDSQAFIDWAWHGEIIERFVLAFSYPYGGAITFNRDTEVRVLDCTFLDDVAFNHPFFNGLIFRVHEDTMHVCCNGGTIVLSGPHLKAHRPLRVGDRLNTPRSQLDRALSLRPVYTPTGLRS